jgi:hypothetical protein
MDDRDILPRLDAIESRLAELNERLTSVSPGEIFPPHHKVYQVAYQDRDHESGKPIKTVLLAAELPRMPCSLVPVLSQILGKLEGCVSVRRRQGESMADDLIAILKRDQE